MRVLNIHQREFKTDLKTLGEILDTLASREDKVWPYEKWPRMRFDSGLKMGAKGGHGPIRYLVDEYVPGQNVKFKFTSPKGFNGYHDFQIVAREDSCRLIHTVDMDISGNAVFTWPMIFGPLHDALLEDGLDKVAKLTGQEPVKKGWSLWVRLLRKAFGNVSKKSR